MNLATPRTVYMPGDAPSKPARPYTNEDLIADLRKIGVPPRLCKAELPMVPKAIQALLSWQDFPERPFGMVGKGGVGKSCALVYGMKQVLLQEHASKGRLLSPDPIAFRWIGWPALAIRMKNLTSRREWESPEASLLPLIDWVCEDPAGHILILDDIGEENIKTDSYTSEQLALLIDEAYNHEARVFWTANKTVGDLKNAYGYRLVSRLCGLSPDAELPPDLPDLRVQVM